MRQNVIFLLVILFVFFYSITSFSSSDFKDLLQRYSQNSGIKMVFTKETNLKLLKKKKISNGEIFLSRGRILLEVKDHLSTRILFDGKYLWYIRSPKKKKKEIVKMDLDITNGNRMLISFLFEPDLFFQQFRFVSSRFKGRSRILNFEPINTNSEIQSFSAKVEGKLILTAWLKWKNLGNEEKYSFSNIRFNQNIPVNFFQVDMQ